MVYGVYLHLLTMELEEKIIKDSKALFMKYGIKSVSMDDIAKQLGISKKTIYQYFSNKADLLSQVLQQHTSNEKCEFENIKEDSEDAIDEIVKMARYAIEQLKGLSPHTVYDLQKYYGDSYKAWEKFHRRYVFDLIKENMLRGIQEKLYRSDINADFIAKIYIEMINVLTDRDKFPMFDKHFDKLYLQFINYHLRGVVSDLGSKQLEKHLNKIKV